MMRRTQSSWMIIPSSKGTTADEPRTGTNNKRPVDVSK